jgi:hypothetical protein
MRHGFILFLALAGCGDRSLAPALDAEPPPGPAFAGAEVPVAPRTPRPDDDAIGWSLAVDDEAVYWTTVSGKIVRRAKLGPASEQVLAESRADFATLALNASWVYYSVCPTASITCSLRRVAKSGGPSQTLVEGELLAGALVVDESGLYWVTGDGRVRARPTSGGPVVELAGATEPGESRRMPHFVVGDAERIYWSAGSALHSVRKTGGDAIQLVSVVESRNPVGLAVAGEHLYWAAAGAVELHSDGSYGFPNGALRRVAVAGGAPSTVQEFLPWPSGVVVGANAVNLYVTCAPHLLLKVENGVQTGSNQILETGHVSHALARDATHLYWSAAGVLRARAM